MPEQRDCCLNVTDIETSVWRTGPVVSMSQPAKRGSGETHGIKVESNKPPTHRYRYHFIVSLPRSHQKLLTAPWHLSCLKHWCEAFSWWHELSLERTEIHPDCMFVSQTENKPFSNDGRQNLFETNPNSEKAVYVYLLLPAGVATQLSYLVLFEFRY